MVTPPKFNIAPEKFWLEDYILLGFGNFSWENSLLNFGGLILAKVAGILLYLRSTPHPVTVTTRIITFLVGNPYKPSFATVTGWGVDPSYTLE